MFQNLPRTVEVDVDEGDGFERLAPNAFYVDGVDVILDRPPMAGSKIRIEYHVDPRVEPGY